MSTFLKTAMIVALALTTSVSSADDGQVETIDNGPFRVELVGDIVVDAPLELVWQVLTDVEAYPEWNPAVLEVGPSGVDVFRRGALLDLTVELGGRARKQPVEVLNAARPGAPEGVEWIYRSADFATKVGWLREQRLHDLEPAADGKTRLIVTAIFTGFVWAAPVRDTSSQLERLLAALKARAEELAHEAP